MSSSPSPKPDAEADADADADAVADLGPGPDANLNADPEADWSPAPEADHDPNPEADWGPAPEADHDPNPEADLNSDPEADLNPDPEADLNPDPQADLNADPDADLPPDPEADSSSDPDADLSADADPNPDADPDPEVAPATDFAPVISGTPMTQALVGNVYSFTPTASDPDGDALSFSVVNLPPWASFDASTGHLSGTPQVQHVGTHDSITISVTANGKTASLPVFDIDVVAVGAESITLTWLPPTENEDGSALMDLAGYKIRYGFAPGSYTQTITIANPGLSSWQIDNLVKATYYFVISAYNSSGAESRYSNEASKSF